MEPRLTLQVLKDMVTKAEEYHGYKLDEKEVRIKVNDDGTWYAWLTDGAQWNPYMKAFIHLERG